MGIHIALVGVAHPHGAPYLETLQSLKDVEGIYLWDEDINLLETVKRKYPHKIVGLYQDIAKLLKNPCVKAGLIALPSNRIPLAAGQFLRSGKHVLVEKPGARQAAELAPIVKLARDKGLVFSVSYPTRCKPVALAIRNRISKGKLGRVISFEARWIASQVMFRNPSLWLFKKEIAGGGILSWLGCHLIDLLRFLLDDEVESVSCQSANLSGESIDVEDTICLTLRFSRGSIGTMRLGYHLPVSKSGYVGSSNDTYLCVNGSDGFVRWIPKGEQSGEYEFQSVQPPFQGRGLNREILEVEEKLGYSGYEGWAFVRQFVQAVDSGSTAAVVDGQDALNTLKVIDAAYLASESGRTIILDNDELLSAETQPGTS